MCYIYLSHFCFLTSQKPKYWQNSFSHFKKKLRIFFLKQTPVNVSCKEGLIYLGVKICCLIANNNCSCIMSINYQFKFKTNLLVVNSIWLNAASPLGNTKEQNYMFLPENRIRAFTVEIIVSSCPVFAQWFRIQRYTRKKNLNGKHRCCKLRKRENR